MAKIKLKKSIKAKSGVRLALVVSQYNQTISNTLEKNCLQELRRSGVVSKNISVIHVPGAFEIPFACQRVIKTKKPDAVIALGCIIRGETSHFDFIASAATVGIMEVSLKYGVPVIFGVLTVNSLAQAKARLSKGTEAAQTALHCLNL